MTDITRQTDILERRKLSQQIVRLKDKADALIAELREGTILQTTHIDTIYGHLATIARHESPHDLQQRTLSCATRTRDRNHLALRHLERDAS